MLTSRDHGNRVGLPGQVPVSRPVRYLRSDRSPDRLAASRGQGGVLIRSDRTADVDPPSMCEQICTPGDRLVDLGQPRVRPYRPTGTRDRRQLPGLGRHDRNRLAAHRPNPQRPRRLPARTGQTLGPRSRRRPRRVDSRHSAMRTVRSSSTDGRRAFCVNA